MQQNIKNFLNHFSNEIELIMEILKKLCAAKIPQERRNLIMSLLHGSPHIQHYQEFDNIYSYLNANKEITVAITAHYDIANVDSDNCLDNNASILNLINLHNKLDNAKSYLKYNILVAFIDAEESVDVYKCGINHLVHNFDIDQLIDLELTASGEHIIINKYGKFDIFDYPVYKMPFNNAATADWWDFQQKRGSACLTTMTDEDIEELKQKGFCKRWSNCHKKSDTIDWANISHMNKLVDTLFSHLTELPTESFNSKLKTILG